jgi:hypothetical protein
MAKQRHYIHGDRHESDPALYYCSACARFFDEDHFGKYHVEANVDLYHSDIRHLSNIMSGGGHHRPHDPENLFS